MIYGNFSCPGGHSPTFDRTVISRKGETSPALNQRIYSTLMSWFNQSTLWPFYIVRAEDKLLITPRIARAPEGTPPIHKNPDPGVLLLFCAVAVAYHYVAALWEMRVESPANKRSWEVSFIKDERGYQGKLQQQRPRPMSVTTRWIMVMMMKSSMSSHYKGRICTYLR